jgi:hypothetical protein
MYRYRGAVLLAAFGLLVGCKTERQVPAADEAPIPGSIADKVAHAVSAGPEWIAGLATVEQWPLADTAQFVVLRAASGSWTCFPDQPGTPRVDPLCADDQFLRWLTAWRDHARSPQVTGMAVAYTLKGFQVASATEPMKARPDSGQSWVELPPAVLLAMPDAAAYRGMAVKRPAAGPWVLWAGTPWAVMVVPMAEVTIAVTATPNGKK